MRFPPLRLAAVLAALLGSAACVSKPNAGAQIFTIDPPALAAPKSSPGLPIVSVDRVEVAPEFSARSLTYRTGPHSFERDPYAVLAATPRDLVLAVLRTSLANSDFVSEVVEVGGPQSPDVLVEAYVSDLEGDFTVADKPVAIIGMELVVITVPAPPAPVVSVVRKSYVRRLPLSEKTAAAVVTAWNQGVTSILGEFLIDMKAALPPPTPASSTQTH